MEDQSEDFNRILAIIRNPQNRKIHEKSLIRLVNLFYDKHRIKYLDDLRGLINLYQSCLVLTHAINQADEKFRIEVEII